MKKVTLKVDEILKYTREVVIEVPDDMTEEDLNNALDEAQRRADCVEDFVSRLTRNSEIVAKEPWDDSTDSPDSVEVECDDYEWGEEE